ncbi:MAG: hypothetical protein U1E62_05345 [Alsobacter sp.]
MAMFDDFTLEELRAFRTSLARAMLNGMLTVRHGDRIVTYKSQAEQERALALLNQEIDTRSSSKSVGSVIVVARPGLGY